MKQMEPDVYIPLCSCSGAIAKFRCIVKEYPYIRGMLSYAITWPLCSLTQEYLERRTLANADWARAFRFFIFGTFFMSPLYYTWLKLTAPFFKGKDMATAITRSIIERVTFAPFGLSYFFFVMSLLEMQPLSACINEVKEKFWPTFKMGCLYWPLAQTINFYFISEKNRLLFRSFSSFIWTVYLGHVKSIKKRRAERRSARERRCTRVRRRQSCCGHCDYYY